MAEFLWKQSPELNLLDFTVTLVIVINDVIGGLSWKGLK